MVSTLLSKWFCLNFVHFEPYDLVHTSPACGPSTYQTMYGETLDFQCQHLQRQHGKVLMANFLQKLIFHRTFYVTITDADIESIKFLPKLFDKYLDHMLLKFEQNHMIRNV